MRLHTLNLIRAALILALWSNLSAAEGQAPSNPLLCSTIRYVSGAGVRMRESADSAAKIIGILKFNQGICLERQVGDWSEVRLEGQSATGWVQSQFLVETSISKVVLYRTLFNAEKSNDQHAVIRTAERMLDLEEFSMGNVRLELLERLANGYTKVGNKKKAAEVRAIAELPFEPALEFSSFPSSLFDHWFFHIFSNSSWFEAEQFARHSLKEELIFVFDELERVRHSDSDYLRTFNAIDHYHQNFFLKLYQISFSRDAQPEFSKLRSRLHDPKLLRLVLPVNLRNEPERSGIHGAIASTLSGSLVNRPEIIETIMRRCVSGDLGPIWKLISEKHVRGNYVNLVRCSSSEDLGAVLTRFKSIVTSENLTDLVDSKFIEREKLAVFYAQLPEATRSNSALIERLMSVGADIYRSIPAELRSSAKMRDYAAGWSSCQSIVSVNSEDEELLRRAVAPLTASCLKLVHPKLMRDFSFATWAVGRHPELISAFSVKFQIDPRMIKLLESVSRGKECPFKKLPMEMGIMEVRKLVASIHDCLAALQPQHFDDPEIYRRVTGAKVSYKLLAQLPKRFLEDPLVVTNLPDRYTTHAEFELFRSLANTGTIRNIVAKFGLKKLSEVRSLHFIEDDYELDVYSVPFCLIHLPNFDWIDVIQVAKERGESCEAWRALADDCRLKEQPNWPFGMEWRHLPWAEVNRVFDCEFPVP